MSDGLRPVSVNPVTGVVSYDVSGAADLLAADPAFTSTYASIEDWPGSALTSLAKPAAVYDVPTLAWSANQATGLTSPVEYRPYICGTGSQVTGSNAQADPNIRFAYGVFKTANGASQDLAMYGDTKPQGTAQSATWPIIAEFITGSTNTQVEISFYGSAAPAILIDVNGQPISDTVFVCPSGLGNGKKVLLTFPQARSRRLRVYISGGDGLHAIRVPTGESITKPSETITRRIAIIGDSYVNGAGSSANFPPGGGIFETFATRLLRLMGAQEMILAGIGTTGFCAGTSGGNPANYETRLSTVLSFSPHALVVCGSTNDGADANFAVAGDIQAAVTSLLTTASASVSEIWVTGPVPAAYEGNNEAVRAGVAAAGVGTFLDVNGLFFGSGNASAPNGTGNADIYRLSDGHPTQWGHRAIASAMFRRYVQALES